LPGAPLPPFSPGSPTLPVLPWGPVSPLAPLVPSGPGGPDDPPGPCSDVSCDNQSLVVCTGWPHSHCLQGSLSDLASLEHQLAPKTIAE
jgi:hypothetical protein